MLSHNDLEKEIFSEYLNINNKTTSIMKFFIKKLSEKFNHLGIEITNIETLKDVSIYFEGSVIYHCVGEISEETLKNILLNMYIGICLGSYLQKQYPTSFENMEH